MIKYVWIGPAAGAALLATVVLANAQQIPGSEPPAREKAPDGKPLRTPPAAQPQPPATQPAPEKPRADQFGSDGPKAVQRPDREGPGTTDRPERNGPKGAERPDRDRPKTTDRPDSNRAKGAERPDKTGPATAQPDAGPAAPGRARLSESERGEVGAKLRQMRAERTRAHVSVNIGSRMPRSVRLQPMPGAVLALAPAYRGYSYLMLEDDTIVIVDARTSVVVDVIPAAARIGGLTLSVDQMHFIFATVPRDRPANVRVRLALGAEVPRSVDLSRFPPEIVARIPEMERYRFVVAGDDVAVVDPRDNAVVLVISE